MVMLLETFLRRHGNVVISSEAFLRGLSNLVEKLTNTFTFLVKNSENTSHLILSEKFNEGMVTRDIKLGNL